MKRNKQIRCAVLTLLILSSPFAGAAWTYECTLKDGNTSVVGRIFTIAASGSGTLWVGNTTISQNRIMRTADSQSASLAAYANDDVIKNATGSSFARLFVNRGDGGLSYIGI